MSQDKTDRRRTTKRVGAAAIVTLMALEAFRSVPYKDIAGIWTDGYGNTHGVVPTVHVTEPQARERLIGHVNQFGAGVLECLDREPTQGQFDGMTLLAYNIGVGAPGGRSGFCPSSIVARFNAGDEPWACAGILKFDKARVNGELRVVRGLNNRRWVEYHLCIADTTNWSIQPWALRSSKSST